MGDWDISCAICGTIFSPDRVEIESEQGPSPEGKLRCATFMLSRRGKDDNSTDAAAEPEYYHKYRYDRTKVAAADLEWLTDNDALGLWPHPETPGASNYPSMMGGQEVIFPFHKACYALLARAVKTRTDAEVDEELVYASFVRLSDESVTWFLDIEYGEPAPRDDRSWISHRGDELLVMNPHTTANISARLVRHSGPLDALPHSRVLQDPFGRLPGEIRQSIFEMLQARDIAALRTASYAMHATTIPSSVWKRDLAASMPWLWEMDSVLDNGGQHELNFCRTMLGLDKWTTYGRRESDDFCLTLANRRRVWAVCETIVGEYQKLLGACKVPSQRRWTMQENCCYELEM
ncbi:G protein alpha subunit [Purpureocillium lavendulum]|uniref:G protein alpha subunit n=1 Tax=Purpureocillium lavendulum TaxID=1247861 RepID=A0AB34FW07_9HYPO|nr:G protein alpha subunit [Purpureocillium lavendulum]